MRVRLGCGGSDFDYGDKVPRPRILPAPMSASVFQLKFQIPPFRVDAQCPRMHGHRARARLERWLDIQRIQKQTGILVDKSPGHLWRDKWTALSGPLSRTEDAGCTPHQVTSQNFKRNASRLKVLRGTHDTFVRSATSNFWRVFRARIDFTRRCDALS